MKKHLLLWIALGMIGCRSSKDTSVPDNIPSLLPGFTLIASPNSLEKPGTVIAVDNNGVPQYLGNLDIISEDGIVQPGDASGKRTSSFSSLLSFLGIGKANISGSASANANKQFNYSVILKDCSLQRIPLLKASKQLESTKKLIKDFNAQNDMANYKYYLITEAVKAKQISYQFDKNKVGDADLKAEIGEAISANPAQLRWSNESHLKLDYQFHEPLYVYEKYYRLNIESQITGESMFQLGDAVQQNDPIYDAAH